MEEEQRMAMRTLPRHHPPPLSDRQKKMKMMKEMEMEVAMKMVMMIRMMHLTMTLTRRRRSAGWWVRKQMMEM